MLYFNCHKLRKILKLWQLNAFWLDKNVKVRECAVNERDLKKHKYDVLRLLQIVPAGAKIASGGLVR